jgi:integrase
MAQVGRGLKVSRGGLCRAMARLADKAEPMKPLLRRLNIQQGVEGVGNHAFRHGNTSVMDAENIPLKIRQDRLGHVPDSDLTLGTYTHLASADELATAVRLGELFAPPEELEDMQLASSQAM